MKPIAMFCMVFMLVLFSATAFAEDQNERLNKLEESLKNQQQTIEQQQVTIDTLKTQVNQQSVQSPQAAASAPSPRKRADYSAAALYQSQSVRCVRYLRLLVESHE